MYGGCFPFILHTWFSFTKPLKMSQKYNVKIATEVATMDRIRVCRHLLDPYTCIKFADNLCEECEIKIQ